jgi:sigma-54 dependent transcriptional regulator, acetoin dehydrogenase operon transcriptional activator AcoR
MTDQTSSMGATADPRSLRAAASVPGLVMIYAADLAASPRAIVFSGSKHVVGRAPGPGGFVLVQPAVSRMHAAFSVERDGVHVRNLGSRNGTWINGNRIAEGRLHAGDVVRIGDAIFAFVAERADVHAAYGLGGSVAPDAPRLTLPGVVGGLSMALLSADVELAARSGLPTLVEGEVGAGKELVALGIHRASGRKGPVEVFRCSALRSEDELARAAERGTLVLDEVADLDRDAQAAVVRVLAAPGGLTVATTHANLAQLVAEQRFRADLYSRLTASVVSVPPLRARKEDLYLLVRAVLRGLGMDNVEPSLGLMVALALHDFPFNVRELANLIMAAAHRLDRRGGQVLGTKHLPPNFAIKASRDNAANSVVPAPSRAPSEADLKALLTTHRGNVAAVARELARDPAQVYRWLKRFRLDPNAFR